MRLLLCGRRATRFPFSGFFSFRLRFRSRLRRARKRKQRRRSSQSATRKTAPKLGQPTLLRSIRARDAPSQRVSAARARARQSDGRRPEVKGGRASGAQTKIEPYLRGCVREQCVCLRCVALCFARCARRWRAHLRLASHLIESAQRSASADRTLLGRCEQRMIIQSAL